MENNIEEIINFDYIREAYIAEKNESKLSNIPKDFFKKVGNYIKIKEEMLKKIQDEKVKYELKNAKKMIDEIILLRLKKIIEGVFVFLRSGGIPPNMLEPEEKFFFRIIDLVKELRKNLLFSDQQKGELGITIGELKENEKGKVRIKIREEIPKFLGPDGNYYGPFEKEAVIEIEKKIASYLVEAGFASFIEDTSNNGK